MLNTTTPERRHYHYIHLTEEAREDKGICLMLLSWQIGRAGVPRQVMRYQAPVLKYHAILALQENL